MDSILNSFEVASHAREGGVCGGGGGGGGRYFYRPSIECRHSVLVLLTMMEFFHFVRNFTVNFLSYCPITVLRMICDKLVDLLTNCTSLIAFQSSRHRKSLNMADINIAGVVAIIVFYLLILGIGLWAARRRKEGEEEAMLAGRSIGMLVGTFTLTGNIKMYHWRIIELWFSFLTSD